MYFPETFWIVALGLFSYLVVRILNQMFFVAYFQFQVVLRLQGETFLNLLKIYKKRRNIVMEAIFCNAAGFTS